jgi:hypothetical protein
MLFLGGIVNGPTLSSITRLSTVVGARIIAGKMIVPVKKRNHCRLFSFNRADGIELGPNRIY